MRANNEYIRYAILVSRLKFIITRDFRLADDSFRANMATVRTPFYYELQLFLPLVLPLITRIAVRSRTKTRVIFLLLFFASSTRRINSVPIHIDVVSFA